MLVVVDAVAGGVVEVYGRPACADGNGGATEGNDHRGYRRIDIPSVVLAQQGIMPLKGTALVLASMPQGREYTGVIAQKPRLSTTERTEVDDICRFLDSDI